jgi:hypothetical protein
MYRQFNVRVPEDVVFELKLAAVEDHSDMGILTTEALRQYLNERKKQTAPLIGLSGAVCEQD